MNTVEHFAAALQTFASGVLHRPNGLKKVTAQIQLQINKNVHKFTVMSVFTTCLLPPGGKEVRVRSITAGFTTLVTKIFNPLVLLLAAMLPRRAEEKSEEAFAS